MIDQQLLQPNHIPNGDHWESQREGQPVSGLANSGRCSRQPPSTLEQITKYLSVSKPRPGRIIPAHQPVRPSVCRFPRHGRRLKTREQPESRSIALSWSSLGFVSDLNVVEDHAAIEPQRGERRSLRFDDDLRFGGQGHGLRRKGVLAIAQ